MPTHPARFMADKLVKVRMLESTLGLIVGEVSEFYPTFAADLVERKKAEYLDKPEHAPKGDKMLRSVAKRKVVSNG